MKAKPLLRLASSSNKLRTISQYGLRAAGPAVLTFMLLSALGAFAAERAPRYRLHVIEPPPGVSWMDLADLNNSGDVLGNAGRPFIYSRGKMTFFSFDAASSLATGINDLGQIVGLRRSGLSDPWHPCLFSDGKVIDLDTFTGQPLATVIDINNAGVIAGELYLTNLMEGWLYQLAAFIYPDGTVTTPPVPVGARSLRVLAMNNSGQSAGWIEWLWPGPPSTAAIFSETETVVIPLDSRNTAAEGINDSGAAVGRYLGGGYVFENGVVNILPSFSASDINNAGQIVGMSGGRLFLYSGGVLYDLNDLVNGGQDVTIGTPRKINDRGQILGYGVRGSTTVGYLLTPIGAR